MKRAAHESTIDVYKRDYSDYSLQFNRWFLKSIGAWPESSANQSITGSILIITLRLVCWLLILFVSLPSILYIIFEEKDFYLKLRALGPASYCFLGGVNYYSLLHHGSRICKSIEHIEKDWRMAKRNDREVMLKNARIGRTISAVCAFIMEGGVLCFNLMIRISPIIQIIDNETVVIGQLACPSFNMIVDTRISPVYDVMFIVQCISITVVNIVTISACSLAAVFAMHACGQLNIVILHLRELVNNKSETVSLGSVIEHHLRVLR